MNFAISLFITLALETAVLLAIFKGQKKSLVIACSVFASTLTYGLFWFAVIPAYSTASPFSLPFFAYPLLVLCYEGFAFVAEAAIYKRLLEKVGWKRALAASFAANAASFVAGIMLGAIF